MSARPTAGAADWQIYIADGVAVELLEWTIKPVFIRLELTYIFLPSTLFIFTVPYPRMLVI